MIFTPDIEMTKYEFPASEVYFYNGLMGMYYRAAEIAFPDHVVTDEAFDPKEMHISPMTQEWLFDFYKKQGFDNNSVNMFLHISGPKVNEALNGYEFEVSEDFIVED